MMAKLAGMMTSIPQASDGLSAPPPEFIAADLVRIGPARVVASHHL
jgi:hypothetical protein